MTLPDDVTRWERTGPNAMGSADRAQRGIYAISVTENLTGRMGEDGTLICPLTGERFSVENGEVDKAEPSLGYVPGNIAMVSKRGNQGRSTLQQHYGDMAGRDRYISDVLIASRNVHPMRKKDAVPVWKALGRGGFEQAVLSGPYGRA